MTAPRYDALMVLASLVLGFAIVAIGAFGVLLPGPMLHVASFRFRPAMLPVIFAVRLVVGAILFAAASDTRFPWTFRVFGVVSFAAAAAIPLIGERRIDTFRQFILVERPPKFVRVVSTAAIGFGAFLIYAVS